MRWVALLALAAGCSFSGGGGSSGDGGDVDIDARIVDGIAPDLTCPARGDLLACYRFDLDTADDTGDHDATVGSGQTAFTAGADGTALAIESAAVITVSDTPGLATESTTIELWLGPKFSQGFVFDLDGRFAVRIYGGGVVRCLAQSGGTQSAEAVVDSERWNHVACTFDPNVGLQIYVNQQARDSNPVMTPLDPPLASPAHIGSDSPGGGTAFLGQLDNLRVWSRALDAAELCAECDAIGDPNM